MCIYNISHGYVSNMFSNKNPPTKNKAMVLISSPKKLKTNRYRFRSVSFPSKSNPILVRLEQHQEHQEQISSSATEKIIVALSGVADLYGFVDEALSLSHPLGERRDIVDDLIDGSLKLLDVCGAARDVVSGLKEAVRDLRSALRRRKDNDSVEELIAKYTRSRKETIKNAKGTLSGLKKVGDDDFDLNDDVFGVRCVGVMSVSVFESLLTFLMTPPECGSGRRGGKWGLVSRLIAAQCTSDQGENELIDADAALHGLICGGCCKKIGLERYELMQREIEKLEVGLEGIENGLNGLFRQLIKTRASLLNLLSF